LKADHFKVYPINFTNDDECGTVAEHATDLANQIKSILNATHSDKVNIVAHGKGGLDAVRYIAHSNSDKVANLVMIGTPNEGTAAAYLDLTSCALAGSHGLWDLQPNSDASKTVDSKQTTYYYTIAGNYSTASLWLVSCIPVTFFKMTDG
jgi:triacylglycerol esterase/lipase EstA (alpha/beta hydrolase family)